MLPGKKQSTVITSACPYCRQVFIVQPTSMKYHKERKCKK